MPRSRSHLLTPWSCPVNRCRNRYRPRRSGFVTWIALWLAGLAVCSCAAEEDAGFNLAPNPDFDQAVNQWGVYGKQRPKLMTASGRGVDGGNAARLVTARAGLAGMQSNAVELNQDTAHPFLISVSARHLTPRQQTPDKWFSITLTAVYTDDSRDWVTLGKNAWFDPSDSDWQVRSLVWQPPRPVKHVRFRLAYNLTGDVLFDRIRLIELTPGARAAGVSVPGGIGAAELKIDFQTAGLPDFLLPYRGQWTVKDGKLVTEHPEPPTGWYLRGKHRYNLRRIAFDIRRESTEGIVYLYTRHWRIMLRENSLTVKYAPKWTQYWYTVHRAIPFAADQRGRFALTLDGKALLVHWNGKRVIHWDSPAGEWEKKVNHSAKLSGPEYQFPDRLPADALRGADEFFVLHVMHGTARFDNLHIGGVRLGIARGFNERKYRMATAVADTRIPRLAPTEAVNVTWELPSKEAAKAAALPAVQNWRIREKVNPAEHYGDKHDRPVRFVEYRMGAKSPGKFPDALFHHDRSYAYGPRHMPQGVHVYFNLAETGLYTMKTEWGRWGIGWGPDVYEVSVDGRPVSREVYRALSNNNYGFPVKDHVPLRLQKGPHRIDLELKLDGVRRANFLQKRLRIPLGHVELSRGVQEPFFNYPANTSSNRAQSADALADPASVGERHGKRLCFRITGVDPDRTYTIKPVFYEVDVPKPGLRLMDIVVNDSRVEKNLDVYRAAGGRFKLLTRTYRARPVRRAIPGRITGWKARTWGGEAPEIALIPDLRDGRPGLRIRGGRRSGVIGQTVTVDQERPVPILVVLEARVKTPRPDLNPSSTALGLSFKPAIYKNAKGTHTWENLGNQVALDPQKTGWQQVRHLWKPQRPVKELTPFIAVPNGVTLEVSRVQAVPVREDVTTTEALASGRNLLVNGNFSGKIPCLEIRILSRRFRAFLNELQILDSAGNAVFHENCGWSENISSKHALKQYTPERKTYEPPPSDDDLFDGHNLVPNPHFTRRDERGKPAFWWSIADFERTFGPIRLEGAGALTGSGEYRLDEETGHDAPGSLRIGNTESGFALLSNCPAIDYGKRQRFSFRARTRGFQGRIYPEILWFAQDMDGPLKGEPTLRLMGRASAEKAVTGTVDWTRAAVTASPPFGASYAALLVHAGDNASGTAWIDDARFDGYGVEPLEITWSRLGYHPASDKHIVVKSLVRAPVAWTLRKTDSGETVRSGKAHFHSHDAIRNRYFYELDLSEFKGPGSYRLMATQAGNRIRTPPFVIDRDRYRVLQRMLLNAMRLKRFNTYTENGHEPGAMEDAEAYVLCDLPRYCTYEKTYRNKKMNVLGGYYDAGDEIKHVEFWPGVLYALWSSWHTTPDLDITDSTTTIDELLWGYSAFHHFQADDGRFYKGVHPQMRATDNIPAYGIERDVGGKIPLAQAGGALALGAYVLRDSHPELSRFNLAAAERHYEAVLAGDSRRDLLVASKALFADLFLYKLTGEQHYADAMDLHAETVAAGLGRHTYRGARELSRSHLFCGGLPQDFVLVPCLFARMYPDHPRVPAVKEGLRAFAADVARVSADTPWGQARDVSTPEGRPGRWCPPTRRPVGYWPALAASLAQIGMLLDDEKIVRLGERQLQWCLGKNFADVSTVHGVGTRWFAGGDKVVHQTEFMVHWLASKRRHMTYDGMVPTLAFRDVWTRGKMEVRNRGGFWPPVEGYPQGYMRLYLQPDYPIHPAPTEYYLPQTAQHLMAAAWIHAALEQLAAR